MKKILSLMLCIVMLTTAIPTVFATTSKVTMQASHTTAYVGDTITFTVSVNGTANAKSAAVAVSFTDKFEFVSGEWLKTGGFMSNYDTNTHKGIFAYTSASDINGDIFKLTLKAKTADANAQDVSINVQYKDGSTQILNETATKSVAIIEELKGTLALTGLTAPIKNSTPVNENDITAPANTTITSVVWSPNHSTFAAETVYSVTINIKANDGYVFDSGVAFSVDGNNWTARKQSDGSYNLTKTFPKTAGKDTPVCVAPANVTATYGQTLTDITLSNGAGNTEGTWSWMTPSTSVGNASATPKNFKAKFVPADSNNYLTVENIDVPVIVNAKNIAITVGTISDQEYTGNQLKPTVVVTGDGKTLELNKDYTVEYGANVNVGANAGSVTVKAKAKGNYTFENATKTFNIVVQAGTVTISGNLNVVYGEEIPDVTINKNGSDGVTTTYYYTNSACTEGKTTTKPTDAGNYWVQVEMAAGTNFGSAASNVLRFTISRADITPEVTISNWEYGATANVPAVTGNNGNGTVTYKYKAKGANDRKYSTTVPTNAGEYTVRAEIAQTNNYNAGSDTADFIITPKTGAVSISGDLNVTYGEEVPDVTINKNGSEGVITTYYYTNADCIDGKTTTKPTNAGNYWVQVEMAAEANYTEAVSNVLGFTIYRADITPVVTITGWAYQDSANAPSITGNKGNGVVTYKYKVKGADDSTYSETVPENAGEYTVKAEIAGTANYNSGSATVDFVISPKTGEVSISGDLNVTYGEEIADVTIDTNGSSGLTTIYYYTDIDCTEGKTTIKPTNAGNYWVQVEMAADANYTEVVSNVLGFTISRADITPAVTITGWTYKDSANIPTVTGNTGNGAEVFKYKVKDTDDITYTTTVPTNAGEYTVKAEIAETANYNAGSATADFVISPKALDSTMVADVANQVYTGNEIKPIPTVTDDTALVNTIDFTYDYEDNIYVGTTAKVKITGKGNYSGEIVKEFSITVAEQTPAITPIVYLTKGGNTIDLKEIVVNAKGDVSFTISGEANGCTMDNGVLTSGENPCTVKINVAITAKDVNGDTVNEYNAYSLADAITVTVNDKETQDTLNITSATTVTYGQTLEITSEGGGGTGAVTYTVTNGTGEATIEGNVLTPSRVGTVTVIATKLEDETYNSISSAPVVITIEKIKVAIPVEDTTVYTYNGAEQTYQIAENAAYTIAGNKQINANETGYVVTIALSDTETHAWTDDSIEVKNYTFIINKATIAVTAKNQQVYVNGTAPVLGTEHYTVTGLVNGETLKIVPTIEYETTPDTSATGSVVIKIYGAEAPDGDNYNQVIHTNGTLTIKNRSYGGGGGGVSTYTVKFETNGGSKVANKTVNINAVLESPEAPVKDGFKFDGWFTDKELTTAYDFTTKVTKGFTLYAKWTEIEKEPGVDEPEDKEEPGVTEWKNTFEDVKEDDWFYTSVQYVAQNKLMNGVAEDEFAPGATLTRAMLVTVLYRNAGEPEVDGDIPFDDVNKDSWYANAVAWAKQNGIVNGVTETDFAPDANITREQIATIMFRYAQYKGMDAVTLEENLHFTDTDEISEYAVSAMNWAVGTGLMNGKSATTINPKDNATRAEIAAILQRFVENIK